MKQIWLTKDIALRIRHHSDGCFNISPDLGISDLWIRKEDDILDIGEHSIATHLVDRVASSRSGVYILDLETLKLSALSCSREGAYYALVPTGTAPTIMISGVQMHRRDDPWGDSMDKAASVIRSGDWVLDTCGGLNYTAQACLFQGAALVISSEPDASVRFLRRSNPWSRKWSDEGLIFHPTTAQKLADSTPDDAFDCIIHDPPRFSLAGELYGYEFYSSLRRIIRRGGRLFHYTGVPYEKRRGRSFVHGVARRLSEAGFKCTWQDAIKGFVGRAV